MEKEFTCASCGSKSKGTAGTCCGAERKDVAVHVCMACQTGVGEHTHGAMEKKSEHTCGHCGYGHEEGKTCDSGM